MDSYRLYRLSGGHIVGVTVFQCACEASAIVLAEDGLEGRAGELWCGSRLVSALNLTLRSEPR